MRVYGCSAQGTSSLYFSVGSVESAEMRKCKLLSCVTSAIAEIGARVRMMALLMSMGRLYRFGLSS